jgi:PAS domain S-box-containing protein
MTPPKRVKKKRPVPSADERQQVKAANEQLVKYRLLVEHAGDAILILQDDRIRYHNPKTAALSGYTSDELCSMDFFDLIHPDDRSAMRERYRNRLMGKDVPDRYTFRVIRKNGDIAWGQINAVRVAWEAQTVVLCFVRDVTSQKQTERLLREAHTQLESMVAQRTQDLLKANAALKKRIADHKRTLTELLRSEKIYRKLFNSAQDGVLVLDDRGVVSDVSQGAEMLFGYSAAEMLDKPFADFVATPSKPIITKSMEALRKLDTVDDEIQVVHRDGTIIDIWCKCTPLTDAKGSFEGVLVYNRDISRRKIMREQLIRTERLAATGQLAASVAHEINSPLQGVIGLIGVMKKTHGDDHKLLKNLGLLEGAFDSIRRTVRNLLDLNRPGKQLLQSIDINQIIENTLALVQSNLRKNKVNIRLNLAERLPKIIGSPQQISQVIMNLINNAVEAMNGVSLTEPWDGRDRPGGAIDFSTFLRNDRVVLEVTDSGPGISKEDLQHIFDPFYTSKKKMGMGVGLTVCHGIIIEHQGAIVAENAPHGGAVFKIELPVPAQGERKRTGGSVS